MLSTGVKPRGADKEHRHLTVPSSNYTLNPRVCQIKTTTHWLFASVSIKGVIDNFRLQAGKQALSSAPLCCQLLPPPACFLRNSAIGQESLSGLSSGAHLRTFCHLLYISSFRWPLKTDYFKYQHLSLSVRKTSHQKNGKSAVVFILTVLLWSWFGKDSLPLLS